MILYNSCEGDELKLVRYDGFENFDVKLIIGNNIIYNIEMERF